MIIPDDFEIKIMLSTFDLKVAFLSSLKIGWDVSVGKGCGLEL